MIRALRSTLFNLAFYLWTVGMIVTCSPALLLPHRAIIRGQALWARGTNSLMRVIAGISIDYRGLEHRPAGGAIVAAKHQSAWETMVWHAILDDPAIIMKKELSYLPIYGWMAHKSRMIIVDRKGGAKALKEMLAQARQAVADGRQIVIFPQGTRTAPGVSDREVPYQPGVSALYRGLDVAVVPVALNSGLFWPRRQFLRQPGTIVLEYLEPIPPGLPRKEFDRLLCERIESATRRLADEGHRGIPQ